MVALGNIKLYFLNHRRHYSRYSRKGIDIVNKARQYVGGATQLICREDLRDIMGERLVRKLLRDMRSDKEHETIWRFAFVAHWEGVRDALGYRGKISKEATQKVASF